MMDDNVIRALEEKNLKVFQFMLENCYDHEKHFHNIFKICVADIEYLEYFDCFVKKLRDLSRRGHCVGVDIRKAIVDNNIVDKRFVDQLEESIITLFPSEYSNKAVLKLFDEFFDNFLSIDKITSLSYICHNNLIKQIKNVNQFKFAIENKFRDCDVISEFFKKYLLETEIETIDEFVMKHLLNYSYLYEILFYLIHHGQDYKANIIVQKRNEKVYFNYEYSMTEYIWKTGDGIIKYTLSHDFERISKSSDFHNMIDIHLELDEEYETDSISDFVLLGCDNKYYDLLLYIQSKKNITDKIIQYTTEENLFEMFDKLNIEVTDELLLKKHSKSLLSLYNKQKEAKFRKTMRRFYGIKVHKDEFNKEFNFIKERDVRYSFKNIELCTEEEKIPVLVALSFTSQLSHFIGEDRLRIIVKGDDVYYGFYTSDENPFLNFRYCPSRFYDV